MRIYCNRTKQEFEDFLGKDIWVRCVENCGGLYYVNVFHIDYKHNILICYLVEADYVDGTSKIGESTRQEYLYFLQNMDESGDRHFTSITQWKIIQPLDTYTTDELIDFFSNMDSYGG